MEYARQEYTSRSELQKNVDSGFPFCPFCGQYPHWMVNTTKGVVRIKCQKCHAKLKLEYGNVIRVIGTGNKNKSHLKLNGTYYSQDLFLLSQNFNPLNTKKYSTNIPNDVYDESAAKKAKSNKRLESIVVPIAFSLLSLTIVAFGIIFILAILNYFIKLF